MGMRERFPETSWILLKRARARTDEGARARGEFAQRYYRPVRDYLYVLLQNGEQAQELAQEFFTKLSEAAGLWEHARPNEGTLFRDYLLQALRNLVMDHYRRNRSEALQVHPDQGSTSGWDLIEPRKYLEAVATFHDDWSGSRWPRPGVECAISASTKDRTCISAFSRRGISAKVTLHLPGTRWARATAWIRRLPGIERRR